MRTAILVALVVVLIGGGYLASQTGGPATRPESGEAHSGHRDFTGKILILTTRSEPEVSTIIEQPSRRQIGGQEFLVGTVVDSDEPEEWRVGLTVWTALDDISQIIEVSDRQELRERLEGPGDLPNSFKGV
jgi:hypothetical protein